VTEWWQWVLALVAAGALGTLLTVGLALWAVPF
jgi:hypothetical protein